MAAEVDAVLRDIEARDWDALRLKLHPYLHWRPAGATETLRGRRTVLAFLEGAPVPPPPAEHELRDDQIYRWRG